MIGNLIAISLLSSKNAGSQDYTRRGKKINRELGLCQIHLKVKLLIPEEILLSILVPQALVDIPRSTIWEKPLMSKTKTYMQERGHWTKQTMEGAEEKVPKTPKNNKVKNS